MKHEHQTMNTVLKIIAQDRERTNILKYFEQKAIAYLVQRVPSWISSDILTTIGLSGNVIVFLSFLLGAYVNPTWLLLGVAGFAISWFGDSLDGRLAYYRKKPRKWYGFSLDFTIDWIGTILMSLGFVVYVHGFWELLGFVFVVLYGWEMITALIRYKVTDKYSIDSGLLGPTEVRIIVSGLLVFEVILHNSILYTGFLACVILLISNISDTIKLLKLANVQDKENMGKENMSKPA